MPERPTRPRRRRRRRAGRAGGVPGPAAVPAPADRGAAVDRLRRADVRGGRAAGLGDQPGAGRAWDAGASAPSGCPCTTRGASRPAPRATSSRWSGACSRASCPAASAAATWTSSDPGGGLPRAAGDAAHLRGRPARPRRLAAALARADHRTRMKAALRQAVNRSAWRRRDPGAVRRAVARPGRRPARVRGAAGRPARRAAAEDAEPLWFEAAQHRAAPPLGRRARRRGGPGRPGGADGRGLGHAAELRGGQPHARPGARLAWELGRKAEPRFKPRSTTPRLAPDRRAGHGPAVPPDGGRRSAARSPRPRCRDGLVSGAFRRQTRTVRGFSVRPGDGHPAGRSTPAVDRRRRSPPRSSSARPGARWSRRRAPSADAPLPDLGPLLSRRGQPARGRPARAVDIT